MTNPNSHPLKPLRNGDGTAGIGRTFTMPRRGEAIRVKLKSKPENPFRLVIHDPRGLISEIEFTRDGKRQVVKLDRQ